jgi:hypothetical protein
LALHTPLMMRARNTIHSACAKPSTSIAATLPAIEISITGRRPWRSLSRPSTGAITNCAAE